MRTTTISGTIGSNYLKTIKTSHYLKIHTIMIFRQRINFKACFLIETICTINICFEWFR